MRDILIDTDIGDDIDDAYALALALKSPELNLKAVTTVFGNVRIRTKLALKLLRTFGREDIPVGEGIGRPFLEKTFRPQAVLETPNQAAVLAEDELLQRPSEKHAVDLIISTVMDARKEVTVIPIEALTNIAAAIIKEPKIVDKANLVVMGGCVTKPLAEHNIRCDPEAAKIVFESGIKITMVGLDVTLRCGLTEEDVKTLENRGLATTKLLSDMTEAWRKNVGKSHWPILHDPLTVATCFDPTLVKTQSKLVYVETRGELTRGFTIASESENSNIQVCVDVDSKRFIRIFMNRITT
ncbi:MAG: nucleoside hydrolase [Nitrososphaeria archaeon]